MINHNLVVYRQHDLGELQGLQSWTLAKIGFRCIHHIGGPLCPTLQDGLLANLLLGESQRRLEVREISFDGVAAAETAA
jgi:hypothetical protein